MQSFAVKHIAAEQGSLALIMKDVRKVPYAYTSKVGEANSAKSGGTVYVVEVIAESGSTTYRLGYRFVAWEAFTRPGGALWRDEFRYKISARPGERADGQYFPSTVQITSVAACDWLASKQPGMAAIPSAVLLDFDAVFADPSNGAAAFA